MEGMALVNLIEEMAALDEDLHWYCPRTGPLDDSTCYDEDFGNSAESDQENAIRQARVDEALSRKQKALTCTQMLAYEGEVALPFQVKVREGIAKQLVRCDICIREYHRARETLKAQVLDQYDQGDVDEFMRKIDAMDKERIISGLDSATETLLDLPPQDRKISTAGVRGMYAMFEALTCIPFLNDEDALQKHFDKPFRLVQTKRKLLISTYVPGMTAFLFSSEPERRAWAERNYDPKKIPRPYYASEFEFGVKIFLEQALRRVNIVSLELNFLPTFWRAVRRIISKLDKPLIQDHLRAMDANIYTIGLEHFQVDASHFTDLITSYKELLEKDSTSFWNAMRTISPQSVIETICRSPTLERSLTSKQELDHGQQAVLVEQMSWMNVFISNIAAASLVTPLRTVLDLCLHKYQGDEYTHYASSVALDTGLACLIVACKRIIAEVNGGPVYTHLIESVSRDHIDVVMKELEGIEKKEEMQISKTQHSALQIVELILTVDVKSLARDRRIILKTNELDQEIGISGLKVWKLSMGKIIAGRPQLPMAVMAAITGLLPLEPLSPNQIKRCQKPAESWNEALNRVLGYVSTILLERLDSFSPEQLVDVFLESSAARGIISLLFNSNDNVHTKALSVLKTLSGEDTRRDCLMHVLDVFFGTSLTAVFNTLKLVSEAQIFGPCPIMLKLLKDIYGCLCDSQDGILRSRTLSTKDVQSLRAVWMKTWSALKTIFEMTESWSSLGHDKQMMQSFCRDTMDFAEFAFDQYSVIAGTLQASEDQSAFDIGRSLLQTTSSVFQSITKWLRLRDDYLISKAVDLTAKILGRLQEVDIKVSSDCSKFVEEILSGKVKTKLTMNHKAELQRALEKHLGESLARPEKAGASIRKKQGVLNDWATSGVRSGSSTPAPDAKPRSGVIDLEKWSSTAERKKGQDARPPMQKVPSLAQQRLAEMQKQDQNNFLLKRKQAMAEKEKQKQAAIAKANLGAGSGVSGIGNFGKDHSMPGQTVMVDDDELDADDDSDDSDIDDDLFGASSKPKKAQRPQLDVSGTIGLKPEVKSGPTRIQRSARSAKDMRARLKPDLTSLHRVILEWDYFHDGDYPPGAQPEHFSAVLNSFRDPTTYQATFEPLLTLEAWQGLVKERGESSSKPYEIQVKNRSNVDSFIEISSLLGQAEQKQLSLSEGDIILLSTAAKPAKDREAPHCLARVYRLKRGQPKGHIEVVYQVLPKSPLGNHLTPQTVIHGIKVQSITPLEREYGALRSLQYYDLCNQIVRAKPSPKTASSARQVDQLKSVYTLNDAQSTAVNGAIDNEGFTLIQGPPGTGKTKTIVAIVGGLLSNTLGGSSTSATRISVPKANGNTITNGDAPSKKLMVCAPSNAAIDEIVIRLRNGVTSRSGTVHQINVVRMGRGANISPQVTDVTMEALVEKKIGGNSSDAKDRERDAAVFKEHSQVSGELRELFAQLNKHNDPNDEDPKLEPNDLKKLNDTISQVKRRKQELGNRIDALKDQQSRQGREQEFNRRRAQQAVIDDAHVICATLSGSGHDMFSTLSVEFETVIIDEAAQCVEASSLIPLKYGCVKCIMVGDPKQLPPTVFSKEAAKFQYEQSLFVRMQNNFPDDVYLLDTQYRMHPDISIFPSRSFYDGMLKDGKNVKEDDDRKQKWHSSALLAPYRFFDVKGQHNSSGNSLVNIAEIDIAMALFDCLMHNFKAEFAPNDAGKRQSIGIITTYKAQLKEMKLRFDNKYGASIADFVEFNTTDAFQGRECDVIIFSCVRASPAGGIGFLSDIRRMNVGLTRAKSSLWVLGNSESLMKGSYWKKLIEDSRARDAYSTGNLHAMLREPLAFPASGSKSSSMLDINNHQADMAEEEALRLQRPDSEMKDVSRMASISGGGDKMDGVQYKFQDRKKSVKDVEMQDADSDASSGVHGEQASRKRNFSAAGLDGSGDMAPQTHARSEERGGLAPAPNDRQPSGSASGSRTGTPQQEKPKAAVLPQPKPLVKAKPAASPFMPKKKPRPPPSR